LDSREAIRRDVEEAYAQHKDTLRAFFRDFARRKDTVDDLTHEVYVELRVRPPAQALRDPSLYLYKVAWNVLRRANRRLRREPETHDHSELERLSNQWGEDAAAQLTAEEHLIHLLGQLPPMYGSVLVLRLREGLTYAEIGVRLGTSTRSVKRHMERVLAHLRSAQW
jgi:RNA polymerase sigma-70 factor (ECF subfamily)